MFTLKRIYEPYSKEDGYRILVDRLWPRGIAKIKAHLDLWLKDIAPSNELRMWFGHDVEKWREFQRRYKKELATNKELLTELHKLEKEHKQVTLLFGAKDTEHNNAVVLQEVL